MSDPRRGRSLELYFVDGTPDGLVTAEMFNWTGHVLMVPKLRLVEALKRREAAYTGVYLLMGEVEGRSRLYIGETEKLSDRIRQHAAAKDWWDRAALVTARDDALNKAHVRYLEARLCEIAQTLGRDLDNGNVPGGAGLSEAQAANMERFLEELRVVLPALGVGAFEDKRRGYVTPTEDAAEKEQPIPTFELRNRKHDITARATLIEGEFVVLEGSLARSTWSATEKQSYSQLYEELCQSAVLVDAVGTDHRMFTRNYAFSSPSAAGAVVTGRSCNGTVEWRVEGTNQTYKDWEAARLAAVSTEEVAA